MYFSSFKYIRYVQVTNNLFEEYKFTGNTGMKVGINYNLMMPSKCQDGDARVTRVLHFVSCCELALLLWASVSVVSVSSTM